jgi:hypothetical protein
MQLVAINPDGTVDLDFNGHPFHLSAAQFLPCRDPGGGITMVGVLTANVTSADGLVTQTFFPSLGPGDAQRIAMHVATLLGIFPNSAAAQAALGAWITAHGGQLAVDPQSV